MELNTGILDIAIESKLFIISMRINETMFNQEARMKKNPETIIWNGMKLVRISDVGEKFLKWLYGQTCPIVEDREDSTNWAYYCDYERFINGLPIID